MLSDVANFNYSETVEKSEIKSVKVQSIQIWATVSVEMGSFSPCFTCV